MSELAGSELRYTAGAEAEAAIGRIGRTEDVKFSPNAKLLAIAGLRTNLILVLRVELDCADGGEGIRLSRPIEIESAVLDGPHGLAWLDDDTLIVANRTGEITIFGLPERPGPARLEPLRIFGPEMGGLINSPGSLSLADAGGGLVELLVCNNYIHNVSRHLLDRNDGFAMVASETLLRRNLDVPDGIAHCPAGRWIAVSNHTQRNVGLYRNDPGLDRRSPPDGLLEGISYPHGLKFLAGGRALLVADAGGPFVHLFVADSDWQGEHRPVASIRVMDANMFKEGQFSLQEGGPKGLDALAGEGLMVTTCQKQPLAFFDLHALPLPDAWIAPPPPGNDAERRREILGGYHARSEKRIYDAVAVATELGRARLERLEREFRESRSWRITAPLRAALDFGRRLRPPRP